jgi:lyso-ornithine lipid O-acyltransferase
LPRALRLVAHLAWGLAQAAWLALGGLRDRPRERLAQAWSWKLLEILGVRLRMEGTPLRGAHLTVANHVSWLDIPLLSALEPTRFVSKSEVRRWPLAGTLAEAAGTFYLRRGRGGTAPLLQRLVPHLRRGGSAVLFPEGTTTDGTEVRQFHPRLFQAALDAGCPVQPVTIQYGLSAGGARIAPFVGEDSLIAHLLRLLRSPGVEARVCYGPPLRHAGTRDALAQEAESCVRAALLPERPAPPAGAPARPGWSTA